MDPAAYDEFGLLHENASEFGLPFEDGPGMPRVRRRDVALAGGGTLSALVWGREGTSADLVLLHGTAMNAHTWDTVALALDRPLIAFDLPGHGRSSWRDDSIYSPENLALAVAEGIERLAPGPVSVVGMSLGGLTALVLADRRPDLVRDLVLVDITPGVNRTKAKAIVDFVDGPQTFPSFDAILARTMEHNPTRSEASLRRGILHNAHQQPDGSWAWNYDRRGRAQPHSEAAAAGPDAVDAAGGAGPSPLWDVMGRMAVPVLLVRGGVSPVVDDDDVVELQRRRPDAEVVVVDGAGHSVQGDRPVELAALLRARLPST